METDKFEKVPLEIFHNADIASKTLARIIEQQIRAKNAKGKTFVLGLATGTSPLLLYKELIRMHEEEGLSFKNVVTFNLDEYYPMERNHPQSYYTYMHRNLFDCIDIPQENINIPDGSIPQDERPDFCEEYEERIAKLGGLDFQVLGIGRTGLIGFNEAGAGSSSRTRSVKLAKVTRQDAAKDFGGEHLVPSGAITMGLETIMEAKEIAVLAFGCRKAEIVRASIEDKITADIPASYIQAHVNAKYYLDESAAEKLTRIREPWLLGNCDWDTRLVRKAVVWLCEKTGKSILKLQDQDYLDYKMDDLIAQFGAGYLVNIKVFNDLQRTITGWPGGKPNADDSNRPERKDPFPKRTIVFSPHPDDDVISMGGTFIRLASQGNDVHVAYHVSGNIAVADEDVVNFIDFTKKFQQQYTPQVKDTSYDKIMNFFRMKKVNDIDSPEAQFAKTIIRQGEALAACRVVGIPAQKVHFLDMPFYHTGTVEKKPLALEDIDIVVQLIREIKPHQIFAAGDWADPHGTHAVCWESIRLALEQLKQEEWMKDCYVWLYRGAWQEWPIHEVDMAVPLSPDELNLKIKAIYCHQSQKDNVLFPGSDKREFWERARDRNHATAQLYDRLGMAEYEAMEVFARYYFM